MVTPTSDFRLPTSDFRRPSPRHPVTRAGPAPVTASEFGQQFINALSLGSVYALVAIGLAMVFSHLAADQLRPRRSADDRRLRHLLLGGAWLAMASLVRSSPSD